VKRLRAALLALWLRVLAGCLPYVLGPDARGAMLAAWHRWIR